MGSAGQRNNVQRGLTSESSASARREPDEVSVVLSPFPLFSSSPVSALHLPHISQRRLQLGKHRCLLVAELLRCGLPTVFLARSPPLASPILLCRFACVDLATSFERDS